MTKYLMDIIKECALKARVSIHKIERGGKRYKVYVQGEKLGLVTVSVNPSDARAFKNITSDMRKVGYHV